MENESLACVSPDRVAEMWPHCRNLIKRAFEYTQLGSFADTEREILDGTQLLWICHNGHEILAAASTRLVPTDAGKVCIIVAGAGSGVNRFAECMKGIEAFARAEGCAKTRIFGRKGWGRVLDGYKSRFVINEKVL